MNQDATAQGAKELTVVGPDGQALSKLPSVGLGLWKIDKAKTAGMVESALKCGYRHLDAACDYGNEAEAGTG